MTIRRTVVLEAAVLAMVILVAVALFWQGGNAEPGGGAGVRSAAPTRGTPATASAGSSIGPAASGSPVAGASPSAGAAASAAPVASPTVSATPGRTPRPTAAPRTTGDPHLAYADFLRRVNDDRSTVDDLNRALTAAVTAGDRDAARAAAVEILDFVDGERIWLLDHPPADCYAAAHASGVAMLEAYQTAASLFVDWAAASGLAGLVVLGKAADAATVAADALTAFGEELGRTRCPA